MTVMSGSDKGHILAPTPDGKASKVPSLTKT